MLQLHITQYGLLGDGSGPVGDEPFQLLLHGIDAKGGSQQIFLGTFDTLANAKTEAAAIFKASLSWTDEGTIGSHSAIFID